MDNGFDKVCPSGNHMVDGSTPYDCEPEIYLSVGDQLKDSNGIYWEIISIHREKYTVIPAENQEKLYSKDELLSEMDLL